MKSLGAVLIAAAVVAIGLALCPSTPSRRRIDPQKLLLKVLRADETTAYTADQVRTCLFYGKRITRTVEVRSIGDTEQMPALSPALADERSPHAQLMTRREMESLILRNYTPLVEGEDTIAGRPCWVLRLKPRQKHFPWKQLWVDKKTFVSLAWRDWSSENQIKRSTKTTRIRYLRSADRAAQAGRSGVEQPHVGSSRPLIAGMHPAGPSYVPKGYRLAAVWWQAGGSGPTQMVYSDGLNWFSIFRGFPGGGQPREQEAPVGAYQWGQGIILSRRIAEKRVTVAGDLPVAEVEKIAGSVP